MFNISFKKLTRTCVFLAVPVFLSGCAITQLDNMQAHTPTGTDFEQSLTKEYLALAAAEKAEFDWSDAETFIQRAIAVQAGHTPVPEAIGARYLPHDKIDLLGSVRTRLVKALDAGARDKAPEDAARAQAMYECWMQEQEENRQPIDIKACRDGFVEAIEKVEHILNPPKKLTPKPAVAKAEPQPEPAPLPSDVVIVFDFASNELTNAAKRMIDDALAEVEASKATRVNVAGHTDTVGNKKDNLLLSYKRAEMVRDYINGKNSNLTTSVSGYGELRLKVKTADKVRNIINRRVEISFTR